MREIVFESHKFLAYVYFYLMFFFLFFRRCILLAQLTIPWEDRLAILNQQNKAKYLDLIGEAVIKGCHANIFPIEMGC